MVDYSASLKASGPPVGATKMVFFVLCQQFFADKIIKIIRSLKRKKVISEREKLTKEGNSSIL